MYFGRYVLALSFGCLILAGCGQSLDVPIAELDGAQPEVIKKFDQARALVIENPDSSEAWGQLGMVFNAHEFMDQAIDCYRRASDLDPQEFRWSYLAAVVLAERDPAQAEIELRRAAKLNSKYAPLHCNLGKAFVKMGRDDEARQEYETAIRIDPNCREALLGLGELELQIGELQQSLEHLLKAADLRFEDNHVHTLLARLYNRLGDKESAEIELELAKAFPRAAPPRDEIRARAQQEAAGNIGIADRARLYFNKQMYREAEELYRRVIAQQSGSASDHLMLGRALAEQGKLQEGIAELETAMSIDDQNSEILSTYGLLLARDGQTNRAIDFFNAALKLNPSSGVNHFYLGMAQQRRGDFEKAFQAYRNALELNPANASAHLYLANLLAQQGDLEQAITQWRLALNYDPKQTQAMMSLLSVYDTKGLYSEKDGFLRQRLQRSPDNPVILKAFATHLAACPDPELRHGPEAIRMAEKIVAINGIEDVQSLLFLAAVLAETGEFDRSLVVLEDARKANAQGRNSQTFSRMIETRRQQYQNRQPAGL